MTRGVYKILRNIWAPVVLGALPILYVVYVDIVTVFAWELPLPILLSTALSILLFIIFLIPTQNLSAASVISSLVLIGLYVFGPLRELLEKIGLSEFKEEAGFISIILINLIIFLISLKILRNQDIRAEWSLRLNWLATIALVLFMLGGLYRHIEHDHDLNNLGPGVPEHIEERTDAPNIYYIITNGLGRLDVLKDGYEIDITSFKEVLKNLATGSYPSSQVAFIAANSRANYTDSHASVASIMNMDLLNDWVVREGSKNYSSEILSEAIQYNKLIPILKKQGYKIISISSGRSDVDLIQADQRSGMSVFYDDLISLVYKITPIGFIINELELYDWQYNRHRGLILKALTNIPQTVEISGPKFVLANILSPEPPFVFNHDGTARSHYGSFGFQDDSNFVGNKRDYMIKYSEQARFIISELIDVLSYISRKDPFGIIVVQGDHGPGLQYHRNSPLLGDSQERLAIFNAYRMGGANPSEVGLDHNTSPVNTFRIILNYTLGLNLPLLENRSYFSTALRPLNFIEIPESMPRILTCRPSPSGRVGRIGPECLEPYPKEPGPPSSTPY